MQRQLESLSNLNLQNPFHGNTNRKEYTYGDVKIVRKV